MLVEILKINIMAKLKTINEKYNFTVLLKENSL